MEDLKYCFLIKILSRGSTDIVVLLEMQMQQEKIRRVHQVVGLDFNVECVPLVGCSGGIVIFFYTGSIGDIEFVEVNCQFILGVVRS